MAAPGMIGWMWQILRRPIGWHPRRVRRIQPPELSIVPSSNVGAPLRPSDVFTPTQPRGGRNTLIGRQEEIEHILQALVEDRAHVVLYSERGRGKTSLANSVLERLRSDGHSVARYQCDASSTFESFIRGLARDLPTALLSSPIRAEGCEGCEAALPEGRVGPGDIVDLFARLSVRSLICVIDEFDRVQDAATRTLLADTMKQLSDRAVPILFMIIGVSESLDQILGQHPSLQRNLVAVHLPLLSDEEIVCLVEKGACGAGLTFPKELVTSIAVIARGMPHIAQLLGLRVAQVVTRGGVAIATDQDLRAGATRMLRDLPAPTLSRFDKITDYGRDPRLVVALWNLATAAHDRWGYISVKEGTKDTLMIGGRPVERSSLSALSEGGVLEHCKGKPGYVGFADRSLLQHVLLRGAVAGLLYQEFKDAVVDEPSVVHRPLPLADLARD
jgi:hypothetical protein